MSSIQTGTETAQLSPAFALEHPLARASRLHQPSGPESIPGVGLPLNPKSRRTIGPIPPRGKDGLYLVADADPEARRIYWPGVTIAEGATKGLKLFEVDLYPEPLARLYARDEDHALKVYKQEFGITRFGEYEPKVSEVKAS